MNVEAPKDVYLAACAQIGAALVKHGYKYSKSGPHCRKRVADIIYQVGCGTSYNNVAGNHVRLDLFGTVFSPTIKKWRAQQPLLNQSDYVAGGQISNLKAVSRRLDWELADANIRQSEIDDAINNIYEVIFPYFARFDDLARLIPYLVDNELPAMQPDRTVEFLLCFADNATARLAASRFFERRPDLIAAYKQEFVRYEDISLHQETPSGYAQQLALFSHLFDFGNLTV